MYTHNKYNKGCVNTPLLCILVAILTRSVTMVLIQESQFQYFGVFRTYKQHFLQLLCKTVITSAQILPLFSYLVVLLMV